ncbi:fimbrial protein [Shewanella indica]|uniref:fimbrial protein n=1 Tax=Shewanella indica TaxID=768528 RepID=UPI003D363ECA
MKCIKNFFWTFLLLVIGGFSGVVEAVTCSRSSSLVDAQMPLAVNNLTVGPDTPNGTVIFRQVFFLGQTLSVHCNSSNSQYQAYKSYNYTLRPLPDSQWHGGPYPQATIYQTGVPGIGVMISAESRPLSIDIKTKYITPANRARDHNFNLGGMVLLFIKTGNVQPGTILGSNLPSSNIRFKAPGANVLLARLKITGSINIVSQTCRVSNVTVPMGQHKIGDKLTGVGKTTEWVDASIRLTNCPRFYGTLKDGNNTYYNYTTEETGVGTFTRNTLGASISPNTSIVDSSKGIMSIKSTTNSAKGVAIQLAEFSYGNFNFYIKFGNLINYDLYNNNNTTATIPLRARYIQTESKVTPGRADATATFTLTYK